MPRYALTRLAVAVPLLIALSFLVFAYVRLIPGDPAEAQLGVHADPETVAALRAQYGLDKPLLQQYGSWVAGALLHGDLGRSYPSRQPVSHIVLDRVPATLQLAVAGLVAALLIALPLGVAAGRRPGSRLDSVLTSATLVGLAVPSFWLGTILIVVFSVRLGWLPSQGYTPLAESPGRSIEYTIMPAVTLGMAIAPYLARLTRALVAEIVGEPFVAHAHHRGLSNAVVTRKYVLRNVWPGLTTVLGLAVGFLLAGSVIVEQLFNWPGTGRLIVSAVTSRDYSLIQALILIYGTVFIIVNLCAEIGQSILDRRIRL